MLSSDGVAAPKTPLTPPFRRKGILTLRHARIPSTSWRAALLHGIVPRHTVLGVRRTPGEDVPKLRDGDVIITGWTSARIPWPRCQAVGVKGGSGVLLG